MPLPYNENMSEALTILATIPPKSQAAGTVDIGPFNVQPMARILLLIQVPTLTGTVDVQGYSSPTNGGTQTAITGATIPQMTSASGTNPIAELEIKSETMSQMTGPWVKFTITVATATTLLNAIVLGSTGDYAPGSDFNNGVVLTPVVL